MANETIAARETVSAWTSKGEAVQTVAVGVAAIRAVGVGALTDEHEESEREVAAARGTSQGRSDRPVPRDATTEMREHDNKNTIAVPHPEEEATGPAVDRTVLQAATQRGVAVKEREETIAAEVAL